MINSEITPNSDKNNAATTGMFKKKILRAYYALSVLIISRNLQLFSTFF